MSKSAKNSLIFIIFATVCFSEIPRIYGNFVHRWALTEIQSKEVSQEGRKSLLVRLPESAAIIETPSEVFDSVHEKDKIYIQYRRNDITKEVTVISYSVRKPE
jgi:hypothetical protein